MSKNIDKAKFYLNENGKELIKNKEVEWQEYNAMGYTLYHLIIAENPMALEEFKNYLKTEQAYQLIQIKKT